MTLHSLPIFVRLAGRPVMLIGEGEAAEAKRRLLERAGAVVVGEDAQAALAIVVDDDDAVARLKVRGVLVNAVDRPELCDFTVPAIVDRSPVIVAVGTGGASAGLAAALRQRLEAWLPATVGGLAEALHGARAMLRERYPDAGDRRRAIGAALGAGGRFDPLRASTEPLAAAFDDEWTLGGELASVRVTSSDPDDLTLRAARVLAQADRVYHSAEVPPAILDRARADAERVAGAPPAVLPPGLSVHLEMHA